MITISIWFVVAWIAITAIGFWLGWRDGKTYGSITAVTNLISDGYLATREKTNGELELVKHPNS